MVVECLQEEFIAEVKQFLLKHENFSLFLLGNLEAYGHKLGQSPNSVNYKVIRST
jgi:hypothetical protein